MSEFRDGVTSSTTTDQSYAVPSETVPEPERYAPEVYETEPETVPEPDASGEPEPAAPVRALPQVGVIMGSDSDWAVMSAAVEALNEFGVPCEVRVISAHRTPLDMAGYAVGAAGRGVKVIIAGAGGAAHLPGMVASLTTLPVIGVPVPLKYLDGMDSLLSIVQMPAGVPVATVSIGGARNAGLLAVRILASHDQQLAEHMRHFQQELAESARSKDATLAELVANLSQS
jgi:5-(carboxyamino)imidazole ribonucleotide mutase